MIGKMVEREIKEKEQERRDLLFKKEENEWKAK